MDDGNENVKSIFTIYGGLKEYPDEVQEYLERMAEEHFETLKDGLAYIFCENRFQCGREGTLSYWLGGLNRSSRKHTEDQVRAIIKASPSILMDRTDDPPNDGDLPIHHFTWSQRSGDDADAEFSHKYSNIQAVQFVPLLAQEGIKSGVFDEEHRGGLLRTNEFYPGEGNVLQHLVRRLPAPPAAQQEGAGGESMELEERNRLVDERYLATLERLLDLGLLKKEDVRDHDLLHHMCDVCSSVIQQEDDYFPVKRFWFLVDLDPGALGCLPGTSWYDRDDEGDHTLSPLHRVSFYSTIEGFRSVFEAGIRHLREEGIRLLFQKDSWGDTPFTDACKRHGREKTLDTIEKVLISYSSRDGGPYNPAKALLLGASTAHNDDDDDNNGISLDYFYFILRREPSLIGNCVSIQHQGSSTGGTNHSVGSNNDHDARNNGSLGCAVGGSSTAAPKRKRRKR